MTRYWIGDAIGRVLGPVSLQVLKDLISRGRLQNLQWASTDGQNWKPLKELPEVLALVEAAAAPRREPAPAEPPDEAARLAAEVKRLRGLSPREQLGVPASAPLDTVRGAFFTKVRQFHPSKVPPGAPASLRRAYEEMFQLLSEAMAQLEKERSRPDEGAPSYSAEQFVGWRREKDHIEVELKLGQDNANLLNDCPQASVGNDGFLLPCRTPLPLFQEVEVLLRFANSSREIRGKGRVVVDNLRAKTPGLGIRFLSLSDEDRKFLQFFARKTQLASKPR